MSHLQIATQAYIESLTATRAGETKLGERVQIIGDNSNWETALEKSDARFVLLGIPEDIGVRANYGIGGTYTLWEPALKALLNVQQTTLLQGETISVLGHFDFSDLMQQSANMDVPDLRGLVAKIDNIVAPVIEKIATAGKIPIVIGGGHNNSYPLLQGISKAYSQPVNCINLDAHSDYRIAEGRHSGNGFRYARQNGYLDKYAVVGLHENYNAANIIAIFEADAGLHYSSYEDIFIRERLSYTQAIEDALKHTTGHPRGIEIDMDCIEGVLSSAITPAGITTVQARQYIYVCASTGNAAYLHIAEGAVRLENGREDAGTAKLAAYLVTDFVKAFVK